mmetsp:Transcript_4922/g.11808  ORF Transcript_4922/g.11808 Transcript_4922/m.11808 type:complete len:240 (-) Transcript_4922:9722-10441(-)
MKVRAMSTRSSTVSSSLLPSFSTSFPFASDSMPLSGPSVILPEFSKAARSFFLNATFCSLSTMHTWCHSPSPISGNLKLAAVAPPARLRWNFGPSMSSLIISLPFSSTAVISTQGERLPTSTFLSAFSIMDIVSPAGSSIIFFISDSRALKVLDFFSSAFEAAGSSAPPTPPFTFFSSNGTTVMLTEFEGPTSTPFFQALARFDFSSAPSFSFASSSSASDPIPGTLASAWESTCTLAF